VPAKQALLALPIEEMPAEETTERQRTAERTPGENHPKEAVVRILAQPPPGNSRRASEQAAQIVGVSHGYVRDASSPVTSQHRYQVTFASAFPTGQRAEQ
jgi:hypothetical protein